jgi:hypothetical protein
MLFWFFMAGCTVAAESGDMPPMPYHDWGACPFECCTYREWVAKEPVTAFRHRNERGEVAFRLKKNEQVIALTGVVITQKTGVTKILKPMKTGYVPGKKDPQLHLMPGELVYPLHYAGEGNDVFWYKGRIYVGEVAIQYVEKEDAITRVLSRPVYVWWVKVKNWAGKTGWTRQTDQFDNKDACG